MAFEEVKLHISGTNALLMHSNRGVNPRDPLAKQLKELTGKRVKTDEDLDQIGRIEWELGLYHNSTVGPYIRPDMVLACMREAAKKSKQGKTVTEAVSIGEPYIRLDYDGPRDVDGLYNDPESRFFDMRPARVAGRTINRARPVFPEWRATFTLLYDAEIINRDDVLRIAEVAGQRVGLGDYRPTFGRFSVKEAR